MKAPKEQLQKMEGIGSTIQIRTSKKKSARSCPDTLQSSSDMWPPTDLACHILLTYSRRCKTPLESLPNMQTEAVSEKLCVPLLALLLCRALPLLHLDLLPHGFAFKLLHLEASIQSSIKPLRAAACLSRFEPLHSLCLLTSETLQCCTACCP